MSIAHVNAFIADVTALKRGSRFYRPSINIDDVFGWETSVKGLINYLRGNHLHAVPMTLFAAVQRCANPHDERLVKYMPAIERLVSVWGTANPYPAAPAVEDAVRSKAMFKFLNALVPLPLALRPNWRDLDTRAHNADGFLTDLGHGYLHRINLGPGLGNLDITARSLLLRAGMGPPSPVRTDNGYIDKLRLTPADLTAMSGRSILDIACGGAIFAAEMAILYGCATDGIDFNAGHVAAAIAEGQRRYVKSMLYLKMLNDRGILNNSPVPAWTGPVIERIVPQLNNIINHYNVNQPHQGDILAGGFAAAAAGIRFGGWDYTTCMYLLCYFDQVQQTTAVRNMCAVTNRMVLLQNGTGLVPHRISFTIRQLFDVRIQTARSRSSTRRHTGY